jgi:hypothetical protein
MFCRGMALLAVATILAALEPTAPAGNPVQKEGTVVSAGAGKLVMKDKDGKQQSFTIDAETQVLINGRPGKLESLEPTMPIRVMINAAGKVLSVATIDGRKKLGNDL